MHKSVLVELSEAIQQLDGHSRVDARMAIGNDSSGRRTLRTLIVDVFPNAWLDDTVNSPLATWPSTPFEYKSESDHVIFMYANIEAQQICRWISQAGEHTLTNYDPRPSQLGNRSRAQSFWMPELQGNALAVRVPSEAQSDHPVMPWPHTRYALTAIRSEYMFNDDGDELGVQNTWNTEDIRVFRDYMAARVELMYGIHDPDRGYIFSDEFVIRVVHPEGWFENVAATPSEVTATVRGLAQLDFKLGRCRVQIEGQPTWGKPYTVTKTNTEVRFPFPPPPPAHAKLILTRDTTVLDKRTITEFPLSSSAEPDLPRPQEGVDADVNEEYEVALSFAGEDREYVEAVASFLQENGVRVFYDRYEEVTLWGKDLVEHLDEVYRSASHYVIMFISQHYADKVWTTHERRSALARALNEKREYILPARFDNTMIPGFRPTIGYIDLQHRSPEEFGNLILQKIERGSRD